MRYAVICALATVSLALTGCPNPNAIGVQIYGSVAVHVQDAGSGQPIAGALVSIGSNYAGNTDVNGNFTFPQIPVGDWQVNANAPGLVGAAPVHVTENNQSSVTVPMTPSNG